MSGHTDLIRALKVLCADKTTADFALGWLLAGRSDLELTRLLAALDEFQRASSRPRVDLLLERYGLPRPQ